MDARVLAGMRTLLGEPVFNMLSPYDVDWCADQPNAWLAAAKAVDLLGGRAKAGHVVKFTADGATFEKTQDWTGWAALLRSQAPAGGEGWDGGWAFLVVP